MRERKCMSSDRFPGRRARVSLPAHPVPLSATDDAWRSRSCGPWCVLHRVLVQLKPDTTAHDLVDYILCVSVSLWPVTGEER